MGKIIYTTDTLKVDSIGDTLKKQEAIKNMLCLIARVSIFIFAITFLIAFTLLMADSWEAGAPYVGVSIGAMFTTFASALLMKL